MLLNYAVNRLLYSNHSLEALVEGEPDVLIADGKIEQKHLDSELITMPELEAAARRQGFASRGESFAPVG